MSGLSSRRPWRSRRRVVAAIGAVVLLGVVAGLVGCSAPPDLSHTAASRLQEAVAGVTGAAAEGRYEEAIDGAVTVRAELERAAEAGELSIDRYRRIDAALTRTETELAALLASAQGPVTPISGEDPVEAEESGGSASESGGAGSTGGVGAESGRGPDADGGPGADGDPGPAEAGRGEPGRDGGPGGGPGGGRGRGSGG